MHSDLRKYTNNFSLPPGKGMKSLIATPPIKGLFVQFLIVICSSLGVFFIEVLEHKQ